MAFFDALSECGTYKSLEILYNQKDFSNSKIVNSVIVKIQNRIGFCKSENLSITRKFLSDGLLSINK